jgi:hypothetical protein
MLANCGYYSNGEIGPPDQRDFAKHFMSLFAAQNSKAISAATDSDLRGQVVPQLPRMIAIFPREKATRVHVYNYTVRSDPNATVYFLDILYEFPSGKDVFAEVALGRAANSYIVKGFNFRVVPRSALDANDFSFRRAPVRGLIFLALLIGAVSITIYALIRCVFTSHIRRKWLWIVFILIGIGRLSLNWTTGQFIFAPLSIQIFSAGALRQNFGPWMFAVSIPLGAMIFLARRKSLIVAPSQAPDTAASS